MIWIVGILIYLILFGTSFMLMKYRQHLREIDVSPYGFDPAIMISAFVPPIGIVYAACDIALAKMGIRE